MTTRRPRLKRGLHGTFGHRARTFHTADSTRVECECGWTHTETGFACSLFAFSAHNAHELEVRAARGEEN
jgi:hypothetical protein